MLRVFTKQVNSEVKCRLEGTNVWIDSYLVPWLYRDLPVEYVPEGTCYEPEHTWGEAQYAHAN